MKISTVFAFTVSSFPGMLACTAAQPASQSAPQDHALNIPASEMKWQKIFPEADEAPRRSPSFIRIPEPGRRGS
jgi:hypothetical protein